MGERGFPTELYVVDRLDARFRTVALTTTRRRSTEEPNESMHLSDRSDRRPIAVAFPHRRDEG